MRHLKVFVIIMQICILGGVLGTPAYAWNPKYECKTTMDNLLLLGVEKNDMSMVQTAISQGANVNCEKNYIPYSSKPWSIALVENNIKMLKYLISVGANVNGNEGHWTGSAMRMTVKAMEKYAYNTFDSDADKAWQYKHFFEIIKLLVDSGGKIEYVYYDSRHSALTEVAQWDEEGKNSQSLQIKRNFMQYFMSKGANVNFRNNGAGYYTPLEAAIFGTRNNADVSTVKMLLAAGASPKQKDANGKTALDWAIHCGNKALIDLLMPMTF